MESKKPVTAINEYIAAFPLKLVAKTFEFRVAENLKKAERKS
jgi:hypothetical protein